MKSRAIALGLVLALIVPGACSNASNSANNRANNSADSNGTGSAGTSITGAPKPSALDEDRYGVAPEPNPNVTYQRDVVIVGGGASSVRSVSDDGLTWRIDSGARDANRLHTGSVMFLTGRAVGRVVDLRREGGDLAVTLGPVDITEVIRDGTFAVVEPVALDAPVSVSAGRPFWAEYDETEAADAVDAAGGGTVPRRVGGLRPVSDERQGPNGAASDEIELTAWHPDTVHEQRTGAGFSVTPRCKDGVGARFTYDADGVRLAGGVTLTMKSPSAAFHLEIKGSKVERAELQINGAAGLRIEIEGATNSGHNINKRLVIPVDFSVPIGQVLGVPFAVTVNQMVGVQTAFSSKDGNISATGEWSFDKSIGFGYANGSFGVQAPDTLAVRNSIVDSISGISIGVTGVIVNYQARFNVGLGAFGFTAGLYFVVTTTAGLTVGSAAGAPIELCRSAQVGLWAQYGVGYTIPEHLVKVINAFLDLINASPIEKQGGVGQTKNLFNRYVLFPDVAICR